MSTVHYFFCPVCSSSDINPLFTVNDHSVSKEDFVIWQCGNCTVRFTQDAPDPYSMKSYYQSEDYISHSNSKKGLVNKVYLSVRNYTLQRKAQLVEAHTLKQGSILDIGAGTGAFLHTMKRRGWITMGVEPDGGARQQALKLYDQQLSDMGDLDHIRPQSLDAVTLWHVLEHVHELHSQIEQLKSLIKKEGRIFIAVPNINSLDNSIYQLFWAAYDVPRHLYHFSPQSMKVLTKVHGLKILDIRPMWFDAFYISLLSSKYKNGKASWLGAAINGIRSNTAAWLYPQQCSSIIYIIGKD